MTRVSGSDVAAIRELRYIDGLTLWQVSARTGLSPQVIQYHAPGRPGKIDNASIRDAFVASTVTPTTIARALGWTFVDRSGCSKPDVTRLKRTLGIVDTVGGHHGQYRQRRRMIDAETAGLIAEALGLQRWEVGA